MRSCHVLVLEPWEVEVEVAGQQWHLGDLCLSLKTWLAFAHSHRRWPKGCLRPDLRLLSIPSYGSHCALGLQMWSIWLSGVKDGDDDDTFALVVRNTIEIDVVTCCAFYASFSACRARMINCYRVDGGWNGDADAGARRTLSHRHPRYYSRHLGVCGGMCCSDNLHFYFVAKVWPLGLAVHDASPHLQCQFAVASSGGELRSLIYGLSL